MTKCHGNSLRGKTVYDDVREACDSIADENIRSVRVCVCVCVKHLDKNHYAPEDEPKAEQGDE